VGTPDPPLDLPPLGRFPYSLVLHGTPLPCRILVVPQWYHLPEAEDPFHSGLIPALAGCHALDGRFIPIGAFLSSPLSLVLLFYPDADVIHGTPGYGAARPSTGRVQRRNPRAGRDDGSFSLSGHIQTRGRESTWYRTRDPVAGLRNPHPGNGAPPAGVTLRPR
jgi:hypothetical protein